ncbi:hypothetical protein N656DRAFT_433896 [Canariomyces notabilis]|uniref:Uncharacterized protein n=1 Tax=Canariomyces notabilis TaxID=2074819 RepID=A0AAN6QHA9_9PEZI|nr:hypothetical protein N656DRAFT_433896 [Canariomyces arenarius]
MVGLYEAGHDPFAAYSGYEYPNFPAHHDHDELELDTGVHFAASSSSPEDHDMQVTSATEPHFPGLALHKPLVAPPYLATSQPFLPNHPHAHATDDDNANFQVDYTSLLGPGPGPNHSNHVQNPAMVGTSTSTGNELEVNINELEPLGAGADANIIRALQSSLRQTARERDEARMQLATAQNELYAARQVGKRLRAERDEYRAQAEFLGRERVKARETEKRLRRERDEARLKSALHVAAAGTATTTAASSHALKGKGGKGSGMGGGVAKGLGVVLGRAGGESPPL